MASRVLRVVERSVVIDQSSLAASATVNVVLARRIDVTPYRTVTAYVRSHVGTLFGQPLSALALNINSDGYTAEDPAATFGANSLPAFQTPNVTTQLGTFTVGQMGVISVPTAVSLLSFDLTATQGATAGTVRVVLSIDLICKEF